MVQSIHALQAEDYMRYRSLALAVFHSEGQELDRVNGMLASAHREEGLCTST